MLENCCAFTGHRSHKFPWKYDETDSRCVALKAVLAEQIAALVNTGVTQFLSGMAEATDTWCALSVLSLREQDPTIKLRVLLFVMVMFPPFSFILKYSVSSSVMYCAVVRPAASLASEIF